MKNLNFFEGEKGAKRIRYVISSLIISAMVCFASILDNKEAIFPEVAALTIGWLVMDKKVWNVSTFEFIIMMTIGAFAGLFISRYSPFHIYFSLLLAFGFVGVVLMTFRISLLPMISACMLPVLLHCRSWAYPLSVFAMSAIIGATRFLLVKKGLHMNIAYKAQQMDIYRGLFYWGLLSFVLAILMVIPVFGEYRYCILPPLVVTYVEFANTKSGFRDRPIQVFFSIVAASVIGATLHFAGLQIGIPAAITALFISTCIFFLFERFTSPFAPAAAIGFIPLIVPQEDLLILPLQVTIGAAILITVALLLYVIYPSRLTA